MKKLGAYSGHAYAMLRFMSGWMFAFHGAQKLLGFLAPAQMPPMTIGSSNSSGVQAPTTSRGVKNLPKTGKPMERMKATSRQPPSLR